MKLSAVRVQRTLNQLQDQTTFQDTHVIPDENPAVPQLNELFGEHTFFVGSDGLHIVEPAEPKASVPAGKVIKLAAWKDRKRTALTPHQPQVTDVIVVLGVDDGTEEEGGDDEPTENEIH